MNGLLAAYLARVPPTAFRWQNLGVTSQGYRAISKTAFKTIEAWFNGTKSYGSSCAVWLKDGDAITDVGDHLFNLFGKERAPNDGHASHLRVFLPAREGEAASAAALAALANEMLQHVPFHSAYLGFVLNTSTLAYSAGYAEPIAARVYAAAQRFRGLEVFLPHLEGYEMATHVRPPTWVTFISRRFLDRLGGRAHIQQELGPGDFTFTDLDHGVSIRAGAAPVLADANRAEDVAPAQRALARILAPLYSDRPATIFEERPPDDTLTWLRRHLSP